MTDNKSTYIEFIGIDVGKFDLEVAFFGDKNTKNYKNTKEGWRSIWKDFKKRSSDALVVVETTGWYERGILDYLSGKGVSTHRASARQIKQFISSYGTIAKTDSIDALALAKYAKERCEHLKHYNVPQKTQDELHLLYERHVDLTRMLVQEKNRLQAPGHNLVASSVKAIISVIEKQIISVFNKLDNIIENSPALRKKYDVLTTIDGVGIMTAIALMAGMPELGNMNRKQAASLAGVAPHPKDSGTKKGYRNIRGGRPNIKNILHMAALGAIRKKDSDIRAFYQHLIDDNKKCKMVALAAVKRKIITIANARLAQIAQI